MSDFNITLFEACEILNKSKKTISRYIRQGRLNPQQVKSQRGTLEYRFSRADIEAFRADETRQAGQTEPEPKKTEFKSDKDKTRRDTPDKTEQTDETGQKTYTADIKGKKEETGQDKTGQGDGIINLLQDTVSLLKDQLTVKDKQIDNLSGKIDQLIERDRETNILIGQLQSKVLMLERPKEADEIKTGEDETEQTGQDTPDGTGQDEPEKKGFLRRIFG